MLENKSNNAIGRVNAILVLNIEGQEKAVVTPLIVRAAETSSKNEHGFSGVCSFSEKTKNHLLKTVFPIVESILEKLRQPQKYFQMSISNIGATSLHDIGINAYGYSTDAASCVAAASVGLEIPVDQGIAITGHIASNDGEIKAVKNLPAKIQAAITAEEIHTIIIPHIHSDTTSQTLSPRETQNVETAILQAKGSIKIITVSDIEDLIKAVFSTESILMASLLFNFFEPLTLSSSNSTPVTRTVCYLNQDNKKRFWQVLEAMLFRERFEDARSFIKTFISYYIDRVEYPKEFGQKIFKILLSLPPATLRNCPGSLFNRADLMSLVKFTENSDFADLKFLFQASTDSPSSLIPIVDVSQNPSESCQTITDLADEIAEKIGRDALSKMTMAIDHARAVYVMNTTVVKNISEFNQTITSFYVFLLRHTSKIIDPIDHQQAAEDALALLERSFANQGGYKQAYLEGLSPQQGGLRYILTKVTEKFKQEEQEKYINYLFKTTVEPLSKKEKTALIKTIMERFRQYLPSEVLNEPESYIEHYSEIFRYYVQSIDNVKSLFNSI